MKSNGTTNQTETFPEVKMIFLQYLNPGYMKIKIIYLLFMYFLKHCLRSLKSQVFLIDRFLPKNDHPLTAYVRVGVEVEKKSIQLLNTAWPSVDFSFQTKITLEPC